MKQTHLFTKTRFEAPKDEVAKNAQLLIRAGFVHKDMAGVYSVLPLGLRVMKKIEQVVRYEMNMIGGQEISLASLQSKELWEKTNRWDDAVVDNWFKTKLKNDTELGLGFTHEEPITEIMKDHIRSYKDLPRSAYQFQTKFRNETRAKSGILRGREFLMKDLYSFSRNEEQHLKFYEKVKEAYWNIFNKVGLGEKTYYTFASGGVFAKFSHEFQTETDAGEDVIYHNIDSGEKKEAINKEVYTDEVKKDLKVGDNVIEKKTVEVGNIFTLGTRFSEPLGLTYVDENGESKPVFMGSYGIGIGRLMGTIVEVLATEKGMIWPESVSPFKVHLVELSQGDEMLKQKAIDLYEELISKGIEVLFDDRDARAGEKFADADLIGIPHRIVISKKTEEKGQLEYSNRITSETTGRSKEEILNILK
ncbi:MAG: aminoacyl--tRNA ligase-related protein [Patescibacteria group bacterium]